MSKKAADVSKFLLGKNIKPSLQRVRIYEYFLKHRNHPSVEQIFLEVVKEIPTLSKTTVYNTLNLFAEAGVVVAVKTDSNELRYDHNVREHGHFKCAGCGMVFDFDLDAGALHSVDLDDYHIQEKNICFRGLCPKCK